MNKPGIVDILLVEDNPHDAELAIRALKKQNLANPIHVVADGVEALDFLFCRGDYAHRSPSAFPKVILLDLKLPKMDGMEVLKTIKKNERTRTIPVVIVTSSREDPDIQESYAWGANSYVVKPVDFDAFFNVMTGLGLYWLLVNQPPVGK